ncbi:hypothetical protein Tsubulata_005447 [Turnera subulata]|uniref:Uncharacterized protein n=1 Tax=Turnera subulata TaxID=218843 RepID=A0A9Q0GEM6_9ROSI|nr:hypothetical protein Tsubulata_005447 [Turnera subulata]
MDEQLNANNGHVAESSVAVAQRMAQEHKTMSNRDVAESSAAAAAAQAMTQPSEIGTQNMPTVPTNTAVNRKRGRPIGATSARKTRAQNTVEENMRNVIPPQPRLPSRGREVTRPNRGRRLNFEGRGVFVAEFGFMVENGFHPSQVLDGKVAP